MFSGNNDIGDFGKKLPEFGEGERLNGFYSAEKREAMLTAAQGTEELLGQWKELEELGNVDDLLTEEEKLWGHIRNIWRRIKK